MRNFGLLHFLNNRRRLNLREECLKELDAMLNAFASRFERGSGGFALLGSYREVIKFERVMIAVMSSFKSCDHTAIVLWG